MTKREKTLGLVLTVSVVIAGHIIAGLWLKKRQASQVTELAELEAQVQTYSSIHDASMLIQNEVDWVDQNAPPKTSFQNAQTDLQNFLTSSSRNLGFSPYAQKLISPQEEATDGKIYQNVKIQISARATEKQIYQWLVEIHQPSKMRILNYITLSPPQNDSELINCQIIAEQWITPK